MKKALGLTTIAAVAAGIWAGFSAGPEAASTIQAGLAILIGATLLLCLWLWYRASPGSGDAVLMPSLVALMSAMVIGMLPKLLWPAAAGLQIAGWIVSIAITAAVLIVQIRRRRIIRAGSPSA